MGKFKRGGLKWQGFYELIIPVFLLSGLQLEMLQNALAEDFSRTVNTPIVVNGQTSWMWSYFSFVNASTQTADSSGFVSSIMPGSLLNTN